MFRVTNTDNKENTVIIQGAFAQNSNVDVASLIFQNYDHDTQQRYDLAEVAVRDAYGSAMSNGYGRFVVRVSSNERLSIKDDKEFSVIQPGVFEVKSGTDSNAVLKVYPTVTNESNATVQLNGSMHITGHLVPTACNRYDLGSSNFPFRDGYFSGNTLYLGDTAIGTESNGDILFRDRRNPSVLRKIVADEIRIGTLDQSIRIVNNNNQVSFVTNVFGSTSCNATDITTGNLTVTGNTMLGNGTEDHVTIKSTMYAMYGLDVNGTLSATTFSGSGAALTGLDTTTPGVRSINTSNYVHVTLAPKVDATSNVAYQATSTANAAASTANAASNIAYATSNYAYTTLTTQGNATSNVAYATSNYAYTTLTTQGNATSNVAYATSNAAYATSNYAYSTLTTQANATSNYAYATLNTLSTQANATSNYSYGLVSSDRPANAISYWNASSNNLQFKDTMVIKDGILGVGTSNPSLGVLQIGGFMYFTASSNSLSELTYDGSQIVPQATVISNIATNTSNYAYGTLTSQLAAVGAEGNAATSNVAYATSNVAYATSNYAYDTLTSKINTTSNVAYAALPATGGTFRNLLINGGFDVWQRGTTATLSSDGYGSADRWKQWTWSVSSTTHSRISLTTDIERQSAPGMRYCVRCHRGTGTSNIGIAQTLERMHLDWVRGKTVTFSAYLRKGSALTANISFQIATLPLEQSTGAAIDSGMITISNDALSTTTFTRFQVSLNVPVNTSAATIYVAVYTSTVVGGANVHFDMTMAQLEVGTVATPFEYRPFATELALCQRYYEKTYNIDVVPGTITSSGIVFWPIINGNRPIYTHYFKTPKRINPTINYYNNSTGALGSARNVDAATNGPIQIDSYGMNSITMYWPSTNSGQTQGHCIGLHLTADAEL